MSRSEEEKRFDKYILQLCKFGETENVHSPTMAMLRKKAQKQLIELIKKGIDCNHRLSKLWTYGYYQPYQFFIRESENVMETPTLLTMFCGEMHEFLQVSDQYAAQINLYLGDLHRYMPDDEIQKSLAAGFYARSVELNPQNGRAFDVFLTVKPNPTLAEKCRLLILAQLAEKAYDTDKKLEEILNDSGDEKFLVDFVNWALFAKSGKAEHQKIGMELIQEFKEILGKNRDADWPMILSACRLASQLSMENDGFIRYMDSFDVITELYLCFYANEMMDTRFLSEAITWICAVSENFGRWDMFKNQPNFSSVSNFSKTKWCELNDAVLNHVNIVFASASLSPLISSSSYSTSLLLNGPKSEPTLEHLSSSVHQLLSLKYPTMKLNSERKTSEPLLRRINQLVAKRLEVSIEQLVEKVSQMNREDWKPVYVVMNYETIVSMIRLARKIWEMDDFICVLPSSVLEELDREKTRNKSVRPVIRALMENQSVGRILMKECSDVMDCVEKCVQSVRVKENSQDHKQIVAVLCENPNENEPIDGVTFYKIAEFYKKCLA
ncbi:unnamed protein product [Caenorhabditis sp. 36 PRJEB53466]|nr:unnamed protein product [Caenorhabditis sp. 36 PRJEB53466]